MNSSRTTTATKKTTQGRQKIEIKKIENVSNRQVTFSKRRAGLFRKACELCILSGAELAIIVKSPGKRTFAVGHPSVDAVIDRYLTRASSYAALDCRAIHEFNQRFDKLCKQLEEEEEEKKRIAMIRESKKANEDGRFWWEKPIDNLGLPELEQYMAALVELKKNLTMRADELRLMKASSSSSLPYNSVFGLNQTTNPPADQFINQTTDFTAADIIPQGFGFWRGHL